MCFSSTPLTTDVGFDLPVRTERRFAVAPAFVRPNIFVDAELAIEIPLGDQYCAADFFSGNEFLRKCLRKESNPLKKAMAERGGFEPPVEVLAPTTV